MRYYVALIYAILLTQVTNAQSVITYDINPGPHRSYPNFFTPFNGRLYFVAFDSTNGAELRSIDSGQSPRLEYDLAKGWETGLYGITIISMGARHGNDFGGTGIATKEMAVVKDGEGKELALYFYGLNGTRGKYTLYKYDGLSAPTPVITNLGADLTANGAELVAIKDKVYFTIVSRTTFSSGLYEYNHNTGTYAKIFTDASENLTAYKSKLWFSSGDKLLEYDPVNRQVHQITSFASLRRVSGAKVIGNLLYFAYDGAYTYDGANVTKIGQDDICLCSASSSGKGADWGNIQFFGDYNGKVYYPCSKSPDCLLCAYDPVTKTTKHIVANSPSNFAVAQNKLFFRGYDANSGYELWSYDGTKASMELDVFPGTSGGTEYSLVSFKDDIYFAGSAGWGNGSAYDFKGLELQKFVPKTSGSGSGGGGTTIAGSADFNGKVIVHPNPADNTCIVNLNLATEQALEIHMFNYMGQQVYVSPVTKYSIGNNSITLPVHELVSGIYTITINDDKHQMVYNTRLVKR